MVVHYFAIGEDGRSAQLKSRVLFITYVTESDSEMGIKNFLTTCVREALGIEFAPLLQTFTFITDCAPDRPAVVGAFVYPTVEPLSKKWMDCIAHQLNTVMRHVIMRIAQRDDVRNLHAINTNLKRFKAVVIFVKKSGGKKHLADGYVLLQKSETRFGMSDDVVARFMKSAALLPPLLHGSI